MVQVTQSIGHASDNIHPLAPIQFHSLQVVAQNAVQASPSHVLVDQEHAPLVQAEAVEPHDVPVTYPRHGLDLVDEALPQSRLFGLHGVQFLHGHYFPVGQSCSVDAAVAAGPDAVLEVEVIRRPYDVVVCDPAVVVPYRKYVAVLRRRRRRRRRLGRKADDLEPKCGEHQPNQNTRQGKIA